MRRKPVKTKQNFYERFQRGEFGNSGINWPTLSDWRSSGYKGKVAIRTKGVGTRCDYNIPYNEIESRYWDFRKNYDATELNISAMQPDEYLILQGEVTRSFRGLYLFGSTVKSMPMRLALRHHGFERCGLVVDLMLRKACDATSYDWLMTLLDEYENHVIEFSALEIPWGSLNLNTLIWEVRQY